MSSGKHPAILLATVGVFGIWSGIDPVDTRLTRFLETLPVMLALPVLLFTCRRFPLTRLTCTLIALHAVTLMPGGRHSYAKVPPGSWMQEGSVRTANNCDKTGHFMQGFGPAIYTREILLRTSPLGRGKWLGFLPGPASATPMAVSRSCALQGGEARIRVICFMLHLPKPR